MANIENRESNEFPSSDRNMVGYLSLEDFQHHDRVYAELPTKLSESTREFFDSAGFTNYRVVLRPALKQELYRAECSIDFPLHVFRMSDFTPFLRISVCRRGGAEVKIFGLTNRSSLKFARTGNELNVLIPLPSDENEVWERLKEWAMEELAE